MLTCEFDYQLPPELIAQEPLPQRDQSRLLVLRRHDCTIEHAHFRQLADYLNPGDCLVFNDSKVIPAKFLAKRPSGGRVDGLFLAEFDGIWQVMLRPAARLKEGEPLALKGCPAEMVLLEYLGRGIWLARTQPAQNSLAILERIGQAPLPPYIKRPLKNDPAADRTRYQTIFARHPGSVAAPTAGLHFSEQMIQTLQDRHLRLAYVTLHVGLGTFAPIQSEHLEQHTMHREYFSIPQAAVAQIRSAKSQHRKILAVGSTSMRVLETAAAVGDIQATQGWTDIFIKPGYSFRGCDALLTNFHLPRSTLLVLVCAFASRELIFQAYQQAIAKRYRFYSYGDAMLIL